VSAAPPRSSSAAESAPASADPSWDLNTSPVEQIEQLEAQAYFDLFAELGKLNPPHFSDYPVLHRMARIGLEPGKPFSLSALPAEHRQAFESESATRLRQIKDSFERIGVRASGWRINLKTIGTY